MTTPATNAHVLPTGSSTSVLTAGSQTSRRLVTVSAVVGATLTTIAMPSADATIKPVSTANQALPQNPTVVHHAPSVRTHKVAPGETLSEIAARHGAATADLEELNGLASADLIVAGTQLKIPATPRRAPAAASGDYTVRPGDTLGHLALRFDTSVAALQAANPSAAGARITAGQTLKLPGSTSATATTSPAAAPGSTYVVREGDTLGHIAERHGIQVASLISANAGISATTTLHIGRTLAIPAVAVTKTKTTTKDGKVGNTFAGRTYSDSVVSAAQRNLDILNSRPAPTRSQMKALIRDAANTYGVDPALALAISYQESGFNMRRVSPANAIGAMQVIPTSGDWASQMAGRKLDLLDPKDNAVAGVLVLRANLRSADTMEQAIGGYYQGLGSIRSRGMYPDTRRYVANVRTLSNKFA